MMEVLTMNRILLSLLLSAVVVSQGFAASYGSGKGGVHTLDSTRAAEAASTAPAAAAPAAAAAVAVPAAAGVAAPTILDTKSKILLFACLVYFHALENGGTFPFTTAKIAELSAEFRALSSSPERRRFQLFLVDWANEQSLISMFLAGTDIGRHIQMATDLPLGLFGVSDPFDCVFAALAGASFLHSGLGSVEAVLNSFYQLAYNITEGRVPDVSGTLLGAAREPLQLAFDQRNQTRRRLGLPEIDRPRHFVPLARAPRPAAAPTAAGTDTLAALGPRGFDFSSSAARPAASAPAPASSADYMTGLFGFRR